MTKYRFLLFDLDGTLYDENRAYQNALAAVGIGSANGGDAGYLEARAQVKRRLPKGHTAASNRLLYFKQMLESQQRFSPAEALDLMHRYEASLESEVRNQWLALNRDSLFSELKKHFHLAIVTNENLRTQLIKLRAIDPAGKLFDTLVTSEESGAEKPDPRVFELALKTLNAKASECLMIGNDSANDVDAALRLGIDAVWTQEFAEPDETVLPFAQNGVPVLRRLDAVKEYLGL